MPGPTATISRKTPIFLEDKPAIIREWNIEEATARVRIVKPAYRLEGPTMEGKEAGGVELTREDTGATILCPFHEKSEWTILATVPDPEATGPHDRPMQFMPFSAGGILALKHLATVPASQELSRQWLATIGEWRDCILDLYQNVPDLVLPEFVSTILTETYLDTVPPAELPAGITAGGLGRLIMANHLRMQITELQGEDALATTREWIGTLQDTYQPMPGSCFRAPLLAAAHGARGRQGAELPERISQQMAATNDTLVREIFAKLTTCLPENITAGMASQKSGPLIARLQEVGAFEISMPGNTEWGQTVQQHIEEVMGRYFNGQYKPDCRLFVTPNEQDVLVVGDHQGSYFYTWPSVSRALTIDTADGTPVITAIAEQIPTATELMTIRQELNALHEAEMKKQLALEEPEVPRSDAPGLM